MARTRRRRKVLMDANNHDRWIVSYADFITLLFAFFVVMYSISSVNQGKYRSLTESLGTAFSNKELEGKALNPDEQQPAFDAVPIIPHNTLTIPFEAVELESQSTLVNEDNWRLAPSAFGGHEQFANIWQQTAVNTVEPALSAMLTPTFEAAKPDKLIEEENPIHQKAPEKNIKPELIPSDFGHTDLQKFLTIPFETTAWDNPPEPETDKKRELSDEILRERKHLNQVSDQLELALGAFIRDDLVAIKRNDYWIELEMNSELLFLSGDAALSKKALPVLKEIAQVINTLPNAVNVEGHTDNVPISNLKYPSNWDLSSARASSVVQEFVKEGINPTRLSAVGYGEFHPIADNSTEGGRFKNRRVTLVLMSQAFARYGANDEERAKLLNLKPTAGLASPPAAQP